MIASPMLRRFRMLTGLGLAATMISLVVWQTLRFPGNRLSAVSDAPAAHRDPANFAGNAACVSCHRDIPLEAFEKTGHARTLTPLADHPIARQLDGKEVEHQTAGNKYDYTLKPDGLEVRSFAYGSSPVLLDWCFGSGQHAHTLVATMVGHLGMTEMLEYRWTWYHELQGIDVTPGQPELTPEVGISNLGRLYDLQGTRKCFACHTTVLPEANGRLDLQNAILGVQCESCHGPAGDHVRWTQSGRSGPQSQMVQIGQLPPLKQVGVCARCHRSSEGVAATDLVPENKGIVRFQSIGFPRSPCFVESTARGERFVCTSCHDPHAPTENLKEISLRTCYSCHQRPNDVHCPIEPEGDRCLECHMPAVKTAAHLHFTDHWIRSHERKQPETQSASE